MASEQNQEKSNYFLSSRDTLNGLLFVLPLMIFYQLGIYLSDFKNLNGADLLTPFLFHNLGKMGLMAFHFLLILSFVTIYASMNKKEKFKLSYIFLILLESVLYSFLMVVLINLILHESLDGKISLGAGALLLILPYFYFSLKKNKNTSMARFSLLTSELILLLLMGATGFMLFQKGMAIHWSSIPSHEAFELALKAVGAGVNEEVIFRLLIFGGLFMITTRYFEWEEFPSFIVASMISSMLFSGAHHIGPQGEAFTPNIFLFRFLAGVVFSIIFVVRGFAAAIYTHTLYDLLVFFQEYWKGV